MDKKDFFEDVNKENKKIASFIKEESDKTIIPDKMNSEELNGLLNKSNERKKQGKILKKRVRIILLKSQRVMKKPILKLNTHMQIVAWLSLKRL